MTEIQILLSDFDDSWQVNTPNGPTSFTTKQKARDWLAAQGYVQKFYPNGSDYWSKEGVA